MPDQPAAKSGGGFMANLKAKWGPLPVWAWLAIITILALGYYLWSNRNSQGQSTAPMSGEPGVVVINQDGTPAPKPGKPPKKKPPPHKHHHHKHGGKDDDDKIEDNPKWDKRSDRKHPDKGGKDTAGTTPPAPTEGTGNGANPSGPATAPASGDVPGASPQPTPSMPGQ